MEHETAVAVRNLHRSLWAIVAVVALIAFFVWGLPAIQHNNADQAAKRDCLAHAVDTGRTDCLK